MIGIVFVSLTSSIKINSSMPVALVTFPLRVKLCLSREMVLCQHFRFINRAMLAAV